MDAALLYLTAVVAVGFAAFLFGLAVGRSQANQELLSKLDRLARMRRRSHIEWRD